MNKHPSQPAEPKLRPHHGYRSWTTIYWGPDKDDAGHFVRHCKRFGREGKLSRRAAVARFRTWLETWKQKRDGPAAPAYTVANLCADYGANADRLYAASEYHKPIRTALKILAARYGSLDVNAINAPLLVALRDDLCKPNAVGPKGKRRTQKLTVKTARAYLTIIKAAFRWGRAECGMVSAVTAADVMMVAPLRQGRCDARDKEPIGPVEWEWVQATCKHLPANVAAMVLLQWHTGMRPGEVRRVRPCDLTIADGYWVFTPPHHKTKHRGKVRQVAIGPEGIKVLRPYTLREVTRHCFQLNRDDNPRHKPGDLFGSEQYRKAVAQAAAKAKVGRWHPNMLRHSYATRVAAEFGLEAAADGLGHANLNTVLIYAERTLKRAADIAKRVG